MNREETIDTLIRGHLISNLKGKWLLMHNTSLILFLIAGLCVPIWGLLSYYKINTPLAMTITMWTIGTALCCFVILRVTVEGYLHYAKKPIKAGTIHELKSLPDKEAEVRYVKTEYFKERDSTFYYVYHNDIKFDNPLILPVGQVRLEIDKDGGKQYYTYKIVEEGYISSYGMPVPSGVWLGDIRLVLTQLPDGYKAGRK